MDRDTIKRDPSSRSRREQLAGVAAGAAGAIAVQGILGPKAASAANGNPMLLGQLNSETYQTTIDNTNTDGDFGLSVLIAATDGTAIIGTADAGVAVHGDSSSGNGVEGATAGAGASGVLGSNGGNGNGVFGYTHNSGASGVYGQNDGSGYGVAGRAASGTGVLGDTSSGTGVLANAATTNATALAVNGAAKFSRSGIVSIAAGKLSATVTSLSPMTSHTIMLATVQNSSGVSVAYTVPNVAHGSFAIFLNKGVPAGKAAKVAWFVVN